jgi:hypothetical protein
MLKPGIYKHYKGANGGEYELIGVAEHENTGEHLVVYRGLYNDHPLYARPLNQFTEMVEWEGKTIPRFEWVRENK